MKQDYLWEKQGTDPEIERLEDLLSGFAYAETPPPVVKREAPISFFRRLLDVRILVPLEVAGLVMAVGILIWTSLGRHQNAEVQAVVVPTNVTAPPAKEADKVIPIKTAEPAQKPVQTVKPTFAKAVVTHKMPTTLVARHSTPKLTNEEKYAYDQLMFALSFTGSKLKMVRDAANNVDDTDSPKTKINR